MKKYRWRIIVGCVLPLISIILFPILGMRTSIAFFAWMIIMFACYLVITGLPEDKSNYFKDKKYSCH